MNNFPLRLVLLLCASLMAGAARGDCGTERWTVKTGTDATVQKIHEDPTPATINQLSLISAPINPMIRPTSRYAPTEFTVYEVTAKIVLVKQEADSDYHIVLKDEKGRTMIVEAPSPDCATGSRFFDQIVAVRRALDDKLGGPVTGPRPNLNLLVTVTGVGFFDRLHRQTGVATNGIELHPILDVIFHAEKTIKQLRERVSNTVVPD